MVSTICDTLVVVVASACTEGLGVLGYEWVLLGFWPSSMQQFTSILLAAEGFRVCVWGK